MSTTRLVAIWLLGLSMGVATLLSAADTRSMASIADLSRTAALGRFE